ncbi:MAG: metallophosphoesterase [Wenzhouxiangella sp.]|jgi:hypothetical protein|nr:metallophosphoesterase [Wenzhouxiangella sp.]
MLVIALTFTAGCAAASEVKQSHSVTGVERIVAIGDLHGDWDGYMASLRAAGLADTRGRWSGRKTHLVQTGDIPSRGPDTRRIIEHMAQLAVQADQAGGQVHNLMGNHEAMNVYGDLRYVTEGEYAAWTDRRSRRLRDQYFKQIRDRLQRDDPERFESLPDDFEARWKAEHPEGWLEHRFAWSPLWNDEAEMYQWVRNQRVAVRINRFVFVHGGISALYCTSSLASWTKRAREALGGSTDEELDILVDPVGPLWYRGLSGVAPVASPATVEAILERYDVDHIVVGHTPTGGAIWPRYDGRVIQIDTGISSYYGGYVAYLEITPEGRFAGYETGRVRLPDGTAGLDEYIAAVEALHPGDTALSSRMADLKKTLIEVDESSQAQQTSDQVSCGIAR